jgi:hypothetical protein
MTFVSRTFIALGALLVGFPPAALHAQAGPPENPMVALPSITNVPCNGLVVSSIDIQPGRPPFEGMVSRWRHVARAVGLHHTTTRPGVIDAFLALSVGQTCTEERRSESERLIRDQPFIADARVRAIPDGAGGVKIVVTTVDEIALLVSGQTHGLNLQSFSLGNGNVKGEGLAAKAFFERGFNYRSGFGLRLVDYALGGRPYVGTLEGYQHPLGYHANVELGHPFLSDLQRVAWHGGYTESDDYPGIGRPAGDPLALEVKQRRWDASSIFRVYGTRTVTLLGVGANGLRITPADTGIVIDRSGLLPDTGQALRNRYQPFRATRVGVIGGVRRVSFARVRGFETLTAAQDVASGVMSGLYVAKGLATYGENDSFLSGAVYAGRASENYLLATQMELEGRRDPTTNSWDSVIGSGRAAMYVGSAPGMVFMIDDRYSTGTRSRLPMQLSIGEGRGGILGYRTSGLAGARRNASRAELRFSREALVRNADVGVATFGETGTVWAGDAPYGQTATRATVGFSLMAAYPSRSKRMYRADFGFPLTRAGTGGGKLEVRFSSEDRTGYFWREPDDVRGARTGAVGSSLFVTPQQ